MPIDRHTLWQLSLATAAAFVLHFAVAGRTPAEWDVANYLLALERFDLHQHRPHPPGYPLYVLLGRALAAVVGDSHRALLLLAALGAALALPCTWLLARCHLPANAAWWTALLACFAPLAWFYGATGLPGIFELPAVPLVLWLLHRGANGSPRAFVLASLVLGLAGGLRPNLLPFLLPVWLLGAVARPLGWRTRLLGTGVLLATIAAWLVPMIADAGGLGPFREASAYLDETLQKESFVRSGAWTALVGNLLRAGSSLTLALGPAGVLGLLLLPRLVRAVRPAPLTPLVVAVVPALLFFVFGFFHKKAYAFVVTAPLLVLAAAALQTLGRRMLATTALASLLLGTGAWLLLPGEDTLLQQPDGHLVAHERLPGGKRLLRHWLMTGRSTLADRDARIAEADRTIAQERAVHPDLLLVVPGEQPYDGRTLMQRWPDRDVWLLPAERTGAPTRARDGELHQASWEAFTAALAKCPSLWLCERADAAVPSDAAPTGQHAFLRLRLPH